MKLYPWHKALWTRLAAARERLPHALLLQGRAGVGKLDFATLLSQSLLCQRPTPDLIACGSCQSCTWFEQGNHPDFRLLEPEDGDANLEEDGVIAKTVRKSQIAVDQVRQLGEFLGLSSHRSGLRIVLMHPAEALNQSSANALLKMLEEPPAGVLFVLVSHQPQRLLATIRSRCSKVDMPMPSRLDAVAWLNDQGVGNAALRLAYAGGAPLLATLQDEDDAKRKIELRSLLCRGGRIDPLAAVALCARSGVAGAIDMLQKWTYDLLAMRLAQYARYHEDCSKCLQDLAKTVDLAKLLDFQRKLDQARRHAEHPLNAELQLEGLIFQYMQMFVMTPQL